MIPTSIDGTDITGATIDGTDVTEITVDGQTVFTSGLPDAADLIANYDFSAGSTTTTFVEDQSGNGHDLTGGPFASLSRTINGVQAGEFDGSTSQRMDVSFTTIAQPITVFAVVEFDGGSGDHRIFDGNSDFMAIQYDGSNIEVFGGGFFIGPDDAQTDDVVTVLFDGVSSEIRLNGTQIATGDIGSNALDGITVGIQRNDILRAFDGLIGQIVVYDGDKSGIFSDVESFLSSKWGVTI